MIQVIIKYGRPVLLAVRKAAGSIPPISWIWGTATGSNWGTLSNRGWGVPTSATAPANITPPSITGTAVVDQTLTINGGTWSAVPYILRYDIYRDTTLITSIATSSSSINYTIPTLFAGSNLKCTVSAINSAGSASADSSNTVAIIETIIQTSGSSAAGAYDINMVLNSSYANYSTQIVRVRRSGDNAEANYGVSSNGYVDWSAITTWVNAGGGTQNGFVVTIYDQSGNGRNFTQSTPSAQMQIISSGVLLTDTGAGSGAVARAAMRASGSQFYEIPSSTSTFNFLHNGGDGWILGVQRFGTTSDPNAAFTLLGNNGTAGANIGINILYDDRASLPRNNGVSQSITRAVSGPANLAASNAADNVITPNQTSISNFRFDADNATASNRAIAWINNGSAIQNNTLTNPPSSSNATFNMQWGATNSILFLTGSLQRLIIWNADLSSQRTTLTTLTNSYYGAY